MSTPENQKRQRVSLEKGTSQSVEKLKEQMRHDQEERARTRIEQMKSSSSAATGTEKGKRKLRSSIATTTTAADPKSSFQSPLIYENFIIDCDGVMWHGDEPIPGSVEACKRLLKAGCKVHFVTNSSSKTREMVAAKLRKLGLVEATANIITTSGSSAARIIKHDFPEVKHVYVIGENGLLQELQVAGIHTEGGSADDDTDASDDTRFLNLAISQNVQMVVCGLDRKFNYAKLAKASLYLQRGCKLMCTNFDAFDVLPPKGNVPGAGCIIAALKASHPQSTALLAGKPSGELLIRLLEDRNMDKSRTIVIGDRVDTDVELAHNAGVASCLVLTGVSTSEHKEKATVTFESLKTFVDSQLGLN